MVALYTAFYNFIRIHKKLRVTPAMQAGIASKVMGFEDIIARIDAKAVPQERSCRRGVFRPRDPWASVALNLFGGGPDVGIGTDVVPAHCHVPA